VRCGYCWGALLLWKTHLLSEEGGALAQIAPLNLECVAADLAPTPRFPDQTCLYLLEK
jgi:hypothetical protein